MSSESQSGAVQIAESTGLDQLRAELQQLRDERAALLERQRRVMELIGSQKAEQIVHDLRNVLNERNLLRALTEDKM